MSEFVMNEPVEEPRSVSIEEYGKLPREKKILYWRVRNRFKLISTLTVNHLKNAHLFAQKKELEYHNVAGLFSELAEQMRTEAEKRGIELPEMDTEFHKRSSKLKKKIKENVDPPIGESV